MLDEHWMKTVGSQRQSISKDARTPTHTVNSREASNDRQWIMGDETTRHERFELDYESWDTRAI